MKTKFCSGCKTIKSVINFNRNKNSKDGFSFYCRTCRKIKAKGRKKNWREVALWKLYKLTLEEYNLLFNKQNGCCAICETHQSKLVRPLFVDHKHNTKEIRGLLCGKCNSGLGLFSDSSELLMKAQKYLSETY